MTGHNTKEIGLRIRRQKEAFDYGRERLAELSGISNSFLSGIECSDRGFPVALLGRLSRVLGLSADYTLSGTEQVTSVSTITDMSSDLDGKCLPELKEFLGAYFKAITIAEKQDD